MEPITVGAQGAAVEDIQGRLASLGYEIDQRETSSQDFGSTTASAVAKFRLDHGLPLGTEVDSATWSELVDETYHMGDRTLYLRLPNYHGADVRQLQECLNILGFSCGEADGYFGAYTEAAVAQFQESQGMLADGMAFDDTFDAVERLRHVWAGKPAAGPHPTGGMGFARAAGVLEVTPLSITAEDPISRNVAGRIWNLACATTEKSGLELVERASDASEGTTCVLVLASTPLADDSKVMNLVCDDLDTLPQRIRTTCEGARGAKPPVIRLELPLGNHYNGTFTTADAQTFAVMLLDAICTAFNN